MQEEIKDFGFKLAKDKKTALDFLVRVGIYTKDGKLSKEYGGE